MVSDEDNCDVFLKKSTFSSFYSIFMYFTLHLPSINTFYGNYFGLIIIISITVFFNVVIPLQYNPLHS